MGTAHSQKRMNKADNGGPQAQQARGPIAPRILDVVGTASYLGISTWTVRDLEAAGILPRVRIPLPNHGELRKLLFDREDLDRLIDIWKDRLSFTQ